MNYLFFIIIALCIALAVVISVDVAAWALFRKELHLVRVVTLLGAMLLFCAAMVAAGFLYEVTRRMS